MTWSEETTGGWGQSLAEPRTKLEIWSFSTSGAPVLRQRKTPTFSGAELEKPHLNVLPSGILLVASFKPGAPESDAANVALEITTKVVQNQSLRPTMIFSAGHRTAELSPREAVSSAQNLSLSSVSSTSSDLCSPLTPFASGAWCVVAARDQVGVIAYLLDATNFQLRARLCLDGATNASFRLTTNHLACADNLGRFLVLDLENGQLVRSLRC